VVVSVVGCSCRSSVNDNFSVLCGLSKWVQWVLSMRGDVGEGLLAVKSLR